jgi:hypothetical protein
VQEPGRPLLGPCAFRTFNSAPGLPFERGCKENLKPARSSRVVRARAVPEATPGKPDHLRRAGTRNQGRGASCALFH